MKKGYNKKDESNQIKSNQIKSNRKTILIVDDYKPLTESIKTVLEDEYNVITAYSGFELVKILQKKKPDMIILDLLLPDIDGYELCRIIREGKRTKDIPVIMFTGVSEKEEKIYGLEAGADCYIDKKSDIEELLLQMKVLFRRIELDRKKDTVFSKGGIYINRKGYEVKVYGRSVRLTPKEFDLFYILVKNQDKILSEKYLYKYLNIKKAEYDNRALDMLLMRLKKKLKSKRISNRIKNVEGKGYKYSLRK